MAELDINGKYVQDASQIAATIINSPFLKDTVIRLTPLESPAKISIGMDTAAEITVDPDSRTTILLDCKN